MVRYLSGFLWMLRLHRIAHSGNFDMKEGEKTGIVHLWWVERVPSFRNHQVDYSKRREIKHFLLVPTSCLESSFLDPGDDCRP